MEPKAVRQGYKPAPFFFAETYDGGDLRLVAWAPSLGAVRQAFEELIKALPASVEVLLKIKAENEGEPPEEDGDQVQPWTRYHGVVAQGALIEAIARCDEFVFQDSRNQLCVRDPASLDYVVLDDVGVLYVYSDDAAFRRVLTRSGFEERVEQRVSERPYWRQTPPRGREQEYEFVRLLRLSAVPGPGEPRAPRSVH